MRTPSARTRLQLTRWLVQHDFRGDRNDLLCHFPPSSILSSYGPTPRCVKALTKQANLFGQVEEEEERLRALTFSFTLESEGRRLDVGFVLSFFHGSISKETHPPPSCLCVYKRGQYKVMIQHSSFAGRNFLGHFLPFKNPLHPPKSPLPHKSKRRRRKTAAGTTAVGFSFLYPYPATQLLLSLLLRRRCGRGLSPGRGSRG